MLSLLHNGKLIASTCSHEAPVLEKHPQAEGFLPSSSAFTKPSDFSCGFPALDSHSLVVLVPKYGDSVSSSAKEGE